MLEQVSHAMRPCQVHNVCTDLSVVMIRAPFRNMDNLLVKHSQFERPMEGPVENLPGNSSD